MQPSGFALAAPRAHPPVPRKQGTFLEVDGDPWGAQNRPLFATTWPRTLELGLGATCGSRAGEARGGQEGSSPSFWAPTSKKRKEKSSTFSLEKGLALDPFSKSKSHFFKRAPRAPTKILKMASDLRTTQLQLASRGANMRLGPRPAHLSSSGKGAGGLDRPWRRGRGREDTCWVPQKPD